jgi:uncharacterized protein (TIGR03083 family)
MDEQIDKTQPLPKTKAELIERIDHARRALDVATAGLSEAQLTAPGLSGGWSVKDHLAHLGAWELGIAALLRKEPRYPAMGLDGPPAPGEDADDLNKVIDERNKALSLEDVRSMLRDAQQGLLDALVPLSDEDLRKTYSHYQPDEPGDDSGEPIMRWIAGNTYEHYAEHLEWIGALVRSKLFRSAES